MRNTGYRIQETAAGRKLPAKTFRDLVVWQKAHDFAMKVYALTKNFPVHEIYGLTSQLRRAAVSVPANIVEGFRKRGKADKARFLNIAQASLEEARYYLILASDLGYGNVAALEASADSVSRLLEAYSRAILTPGPRLQSSKNVASILTPDSRLLSPKETSNGNN